MPRLRLSITIFVFLIALSALVRAEAQDKQVVSDLTSYGGVSRKEARSLIRKISNQMQRAANSIVGLNDPIRRAIRVGMFGAAPTPQQDAVNDAKARLYLYSGLTAQTLRILFRAAPGMMAICAQSFQISKSQCEALVAASAKRPTKEVAQFLGGQPAAIPAQPVAPTQSYPVTRTAPQPTYAPTARPVTTPRTVYQPPPVARTGAATPNASPQANYRPTTSSAANTAAEYKARREKYLASFKQKNEEKKIAREKAREEANKDAAPIVTSKKPTTSKPEVFDTSETETASAAKPTPAPTKKAEPKAEPKPKKSDSLISDLLADPLGKN